MLLKSSFQIWTYKNRMPPHRKTAWRKMQSLLWQKNRRLLQEKRWKRRWESARPPADGYWNEWLKMGGLFKKEAAEIHIIALQNKPDTPLTVRFFTAMKFRQRSLSRPLKRLVPWLWYRESFPEAGSSSYPSNHLTLYIKPPQINLFFLWQFYFVRLFESLKLVPCPMRKQQPICQFHT